jgi:hypothetical protein
MKTLFWFCITQCAFASGCLGTVYGRMSLDNPDTGMDGVRLFMDKTLKKNNWILKRDFTVEAICQFKFSDENLLHAICHFWASNIEKFRFSKRPKSFRKTSDAQNEYWWSWCAFNEWIQQQIIANWYQLTAMYCFMDVEWRLLGKSFQTNLTLKRSFSGKMLKRKYRHLDIFETCVFATIITQCEYGCGCLGKAF